MMRHRRRSSAERWGVAALLVLCAVSGWSVADVPPGSGDFWAFRPVAAGEAPAVRGAGWVVNPVDAFVLARLERGGIKPAPAADRRTLIRRVYFDLTGLPPGAGEVEAFVADPAPDAYEKLVDRLLASPRFGERWARHWLDAVRFAESHGFEMNQPRPSAWRYRDYVIQSFNDDKPYDRFVREQIAGDALGADAATGFLVGGAWDQVKSPDPGLTAQQRMDELHDMVSTTAATFLGVTVGCARCHDHKFDPVTQTDYYRMQAVFAGVQHGERRVHEREYQAGVRRLADARRELDAKLVRFEPKAQPGAKSPRRPAVNPRLNVERFDPVEARFVRITIQATTGNAEPCVDEVEVFAAGDAARNVALASAGAKATASGLLPGFAIHRVDHLIDGQYGNGHSWISDQRGKGWVQIELPRPTRIDTIMWGRDREGKFADRLATRYVVEVADDAAGPWRAVASSDDRVPYRGGAVAQSAPQYESNSPEEARLLADLLTRRREIDAQTQSLDESSPLVYAGVFEQPAGPTHKLYRGEAMQPREVVTPGAVEAIAPTLDLAVDAPERERRLAFAQWLTDPRNPLTARVIVNRLWQHHFGRGIVSTPSDFGHMGGRPTHPELLDWLAARLVAGGWKLKDIHRLIVLSAAYRQSGAFDARAAAIDAGAELLWRFPPRRLEAEEIRDAILAVSGKLDLRMGGPGFDVFKPNDNYVRVYAPKDEFGPPEWRRMIYQFKPRLQQDGTFGAFDCPDGGQIVPKRATSTTPLQALNLLNSSFVLRQATFFANRVEAEAGNDPPARVDLAFKLALGRPPTAPEREAAVGLVRERGLPMLCRSLLNANEFVYVF